MDVFEILGIAGFTCFCLFIICCFVLALRKVLKGDTYCLLESIDFEDKNKFYIIKVNIEDVTVAELDKILTQLNKQIEETGVKDRILFIIPVYSYNNILDVSIHELNGDKFNILELKTNHNLTKAERESVREHILRASKNNSYNPNIISDVVFIDEE